MEIKVLFAQHEATMDDDYRAAALRIAPVERQAVTRGVAVVCGAVLAYRHGNRYLNLIARLRKAT